MLDCKLIHQLPVRLKFGYLLYDSLLECDWPMTTIYY